MMVKCDLCRTDWPRYSAGRPPVLTVQAGLSVFMPMMQVWEVCVRVGERLVAVRVAVRLAGRVIR